MLNKDRRARIEKVFEIFSRGGYFKSSRSSRLLAFVDTFLNNPKKNNAKIILCNFIFSQQSMVY
jgi:hypothetical protein